MEANKDLLQLIREQGTRLIDRCCLDEYLDEEEADIDSFYSELCIQIQEITEDLWEYALESFHSKIDRWHKTGDYLDCDLPDCANKDEIAYLIVKSIRQKISKATNDYKWAQI
jgi:hypothetical protein